MNAIAKAPSKGGRPLKLTPERADHLIRLMEAGSFPGPAAKAAGISGETLRKWLRRGRSDDPQDAEFAAFRARYLAARARAETDAVETLMGLVKDRDMNAIKFFLERGFAERWARTTKHVGTVPTVNVQVNVAHQQAMLSNPEMLDLQCRMDALLAASPKAIEDARESIEV